MKPRAQPQAEVDDQRLGFAELAHELRTPLNSILLLADRAGGAADDLDAAAISSAALRCMALLQFASGTVHREGRARFHLDSLVRRSVEGWKTAVAERPVALRCRLPEATVPPLVGDPIALRQIIDNLIGNAVKYSEQGTIEVRLAIEAVAGGRTVATIEVADSGPGFDPAEVPRLMGAYQRGDSRRPGTGLGLAIVRKLVQATGGTIEIDPVPGEGTVVRLRWVFAGAQAPVQRHAQRVLIGEDDPVMAGLLRVCLEGLGCEVVEARDGGEVLARWQTAAFDLILLDGGLPVFTGMQVARTIRRNENGSAVPLMLLTGLPLGTVREALGGASVEAVIPKPVTLDALEERLQELLPRTVAQ